MGENPTVDMGVGES